MSHVHGLGTKFTGKKRNKGAPYIYTSNKIYPNLLYKSKFTIQMNSKSKLNELRR